MRRRQLLAISGTGVSIAVAGCTGSLMGEDPAYEESDHEDMQLTIEDFPDGWQAEHDANENFDTVFVNEDETIFVLGLTEIEETIEDAEESFEDSKSGFRDPVDYDIGDEAFWDTRNDEIAVTLFRHSNAVGQTAAAEQSGMETNPAQTRSQNYAEALFENWQEIS